MLTQYARSIGVTDADARTARNIHLSVADCKHLKFMLQFANDYIAEKGHRRQWNDALIEYLKGAC